MALVLAFLSAENENRQLEDFSLADFGRIPERFFLSVNCKLKITTMVVFLIMIQRIFPSKELAPTHSTFLIRGLSIHLFFIH